ncbi:MAG: tRNA (adenosine(37)-N6)-threonylcarbamoyltransferase complex dimerization subunit type 1 TsaB [Pseudomonadota bacterium]
MTILAIDTCANLCAAAVFDDEGGLRSRSSDDIGRGHAARLLGIVEEALGAAGAALDDLTKVIVTVGPGSFTGIRVGVSAARGYGIALGIPVDGITTFALLNVEGRQRLAEDDATFVAISGGRGQIFAQRFGSDAAPLGGPFVIAQDQEYLPSLSRTEHLIGNAGSLVAHDNHQGVLLGDRATGDISGAYRAAQSGTFAPEPLYIRDADAKPQNSFALPRKSVLT